MTIWERSKDPDESVDFDLDWTTDLTPEDGSAVDTIETSAWTVPAGLTKTTDSHDDAQRTKIWLTGGTAGQSYLLLNRITTAQGRTLDCTVKLLVNSR